MKKFVLLFISIFLSNFINAQSYHLLSLGSFMQNWTNPDLITVDDDWNGVPSIIGYRGDNLTATTGIDPQTVIADDSPGVKDIIANQTAPNSLISGGVAEFAITDPVVAFQGSGTADAPYLLIYLNSLSRSSIRVQYDLRDIDGSADNAIQAVALQYRIGTTGTFTNVPAGFIADASTGPSIATLVTHVDVTLPQECDDKEFLQLRIITSNAGGNDEWIGVDNIEISSSAISAPPVPIFNPANGATGVLTSVIPTITFDEPVRKTDGSELVNADLATLITFKKTDASGDNVPFTATIDATKKVITVTPSAALINSQLYYLAVGPVEDNQGNESTLKSITFTTIAASTPTITVIYPNGGEVMYSGENKTITWSTTNFDVAETIKVEVWAIDGLTGNYTWRTLSPSTPNDGAYETLVGPDALYGTEYKIRLSGVTNGATDTSDGPFTVISTAATMADLRTYDPGTIIRYEGEAIITFIRTDNRNQKYLQDATGGLLIDDASGVLTTTLANGDKIRYLEGQLGLFAGTLQLVPTKSAVTVISSGNSVTPATMTLPQYLANHTAYESMLVKLTDVYFQGADGTSTFAASTNYTLTDGTNTLQFRTFKATESNIVGTIIPVPHLDLTGIGGIFNTTVQIYSRTTADFSLLTGVDRTREPGISIYPVPATTDLFIRSRMAEVTGIEILDVTGKVVMRYSESSAELIRIPVSTLRKGIYFIKVETAGGKIIRRFVKS